MLQKITGLFFHLFNTVDSKYLGKIGVGSNHSMNCPTTTAQY